MVRLDSPRSYTNTVPEIRIRQLVESDLPNLEWDGEYTHYRKLFEEAYSRMKRGTAVLWVAEHFTGTLIGQVFIQLMCDRPELADGVERAYLYSFRIKPQFRNQGIGSLMLAEVEYDLRRRGFKSLTINVSVENTAAQRLYLRKGFRIVAPDPGIWSYQDHLNAWHTVEEPAYRMMKKL